MRKTVKARYDAEQKVLRLVEPLEGVADDAEVEVEVGATPEVGAKPPWADLRGILSKEEGDEMARRIEEEFPMTSPVPGYKWP